ncbi:NOP protein chaperone 1 isoform X1 [Suncus etruscus]|uniref:NOP protein chaperone 1 isoform X1 n=1 Tax=Suncus etruscus TaxID=109475 RepID=UPI00210F9AB7|nr:NOP protein chaperone 1 isoform X1 [Suncus etruscus]
MEVPVDSRASAGSSSPVRDCPGVSVSKDLLTAGSDGGGIWDKLLINSKPNSGKNSMRQTVRIERSPLLDQVQTFLPQIAKANEKLRKDMAAAPPGQFNIETINGTLGKVIQMDVALIEMNTSESKEKDSSEENSLDSSEEEGDAPFEITIDNIKLPQAHSGKGKIEVLGGPATKATK